MKPEYTQSPLITEFDGDPVQLGTEAGRFVAMTLPCESEGATAEDYANAARIRDTWNACHGLDLPADVPPGILADLVTAATGYSVTKSALDMEMGEPGTLTIGRQERRKRLFAETAEALAGLRAILAKLAPVPTPTPDTAKG